MSAKRVLDGTVAVMPFRRRGGKAPSLQCAFCAHSDRGDGSGLRTAHGARPVRASAQSVADEAMFAPPAVRGASSDARGSSPKSGRRRSGCHRTLHPAVHGSPRRVRKLLSQPEVGLGRISAPDRISAIKRDRGQGRPMALRSGLAQPGERAVIFLPAR